MENFEEYLYTKFCQCLLYDDEIYHQALQGDYDFYLFNHSFLDIFIDLTDHLITKKIIDETRKNKLYTLISYIRDNAIYETTEAKKYFYEILNDLIVSLNMEKFDNSDDYYCREIAKRFNCAGKKISYKDFEDKKSFVKKSLGYDYIFLILHLEEMDEETFDSALDDIINNEYYFASLNAILYEHPKILENETFKRRVKKVIELNKKNLNLLLGKRLPTKVYILKNNFKYSSL